MSPGFTASGEHPSMDLDAVLTRLEKLPKFRELDDKVLRDFSKALEWLSLPGGWRLFSQGDAGDALYVVTSGRLGIIVATPGRPEELVAEIGVGETVGEMALISGEARSGTALAIRDTELLRLAKPVFEAFAKQHPGIMTPIMVLLAERLKRTTQHSTPMHPPRTLAIIPLDASTPCGELRIQLMEVLGTMGLRTQGLDDAAASNSAEWFQNIETQNDLTLYQTEPSPSPWTKLCLRRADHILLAASADGPANALPAFQSTLDGRPQRCVDVVVLESAKGSVNAGWLGSLKGHLRHSVRLGSRQDIARLARIITNRAIGLVLSGGGARALAHLGAVRALRSAGMPFDLVGGTSMGAIIAAGIAFEWDDKELCDRLREAFVENNPLSDLTLPLVALFKGRTVTRLLQRHFGDIQIEELRRPYFCVSSNLTTARAIVHRSGLLRRALRASVAIPGVLTPVVESGEVLVDGGVLNNLPVDVMRAFGRGPVVGIDVAANRALVSANINLEETSLWRLLRHNRRQVPWILSTLLRAGTVSSDVQELAFKRQADVILMPPLETVDLLDWKSFDRIVEVGHRYTMGMLDRAGESPLRSLLVTST